MSATLGETLALGRARLDAAGVAGADLDARLLLERAAGIDRAGQLARSREPVGAGAVERFAGLVAARARRVPLAYLTGEREFWSLPLRVDRRVLIPRPETEVLVEATLARVGPAPRIADLGTGSGAIAIALASERPAAALWAVDCSPAALEVARANALTHGLAGRIEFLEGDLTGPLAPLGGEFDALVSNPPYIPSGDLAGLQPEVRDHEPRTALDGGHDGLAVIRRLVVAAPALLRPGGWLLLELGAGQWGRVRDLVDATGAFDRVERELDLAGIERVLAARRGA